MQLITTTELRTKTSHLVNTLLKGEETRLVHRSRVIGKIVPYYQEKPAMNKTSIKKLKQLIKSMHLPQLSPEEAEKNYREHMENKYGKNLLRR